jgi:hypothetical protein
MMRLMVEIGPNQQRMVNIQSNQWRWRMNQDHKLSITRFEWQMLPDQVDMTDMIPHLEYPGMYRVDNQRMLLIRSLKLLFRLHTMGSLFVQGLLELILVRRPHMMMLRWMVELNRVDMVNM